MTDWQRNNSGSRQSAPNEPTWASRSWGSAANRRLMPQERQDSRALRTGWEAPQADRPKRSRSEKQRPVPKMPKPRRETQVRSPGITVAGTLLIVALTVLAFAGGRLFGRVEEPTPAFQTAVPAPVVTETQQEALVAPTAPVVTG